MIRIDLRAGDARALRRAAHLIQGAPAELQREAAKALRGPAMRAAARQRAKLRGLPRVPHEWKDAGTNLRVEPTSVGASVQGFAVRLPRSSESYGPWLANQGWWYHPTYGKAPVVRQTTDPGWFDDPAREVQPEATRAAASGLAGGVDDLAARIDRLA